ncbi:MAG TPA: hypothetical protein VLF43_02085 [Candidatus Saccharimonadales bacterium]|nr:hypothetical protein [Candidatus Saccharimonadales bacterium]
MTVEVAPFVETWGAIMDLYVTAEATGNREAAMYANDLLEDMAMGEPSAYLAMVTPRRIASLAINRTE